MKRLVAAVYAVRAAMEAAALDATVLPRHPRRVQPAHFRVCLSNLDATYTLRLFAEFEAILRDYWSAVRPSPRQRRTRMEILLNRIGATLKIPSAIVSGAHVVRERRNDIAHQRQPNLGLTFQAAKSALAKFLSFLPLQW